MFHVTGLLLRIISLVVFSANGEKITKQGLVTMRRSKFSPKKAFVSVIKAAFCSQTRFYGSHNYLQLDYIVGSKFVVHYLLLPFLSGIFVLGGLPAPQDPVSDTYWNCLLIIVHMSSFHQSISSTFQSAHLNRDLAQNPYVTFGKTKECRLNNDKFATMDNICRLMSFNVEVSRISLNEFMPA